MRKVIHKWFAAWNFDKEERWLNEMAAKGLGLVSVGFCRYEFEDCTPGEYTFRLQLLDHSPQHPESQKYIEFMETTGVRQVGGMVRWVYFARESSQGPFELFSDNSSRLKYLSRIIQLIAVVGVANLMVGANNVLLAVLQENHYNYIGLINIALALWCGIGSLRLLRKWKRMKREIQLFE